MRRLLYLLCLFAIGLGSFWLLNRQLVYLRRVAAEQTRAQASVVSQAPAPSGQDSPQPDGSAALASAAPDERPRPSRREPQAPWHTSVPPLEAYRVNLEPAHQTALEEFLSVFPAIDPSEAESFQAALVARRRELPEVLDDATYEEHSRWLLRMEAMQEAVVAARGRFSGLVLTEVDGGVGYQLVGFDGPRPIYSRTQNAAAALSTAANLVRMPAGFDPLLGGTVSGDGLVISVNDHGTIYEHAEFQFPGGGSRILFKEINDSGNRNHMTHVAGTVGAWGYDATLTGMAPRTRFRSLIQQSASDVTRWGMVFPGQMNAEFPSQSQSVIGTTSLGSATTNLGQYTSTAASFDQVLFDTPYYQHFYAAANEGSGFSTLGADRPVAKNVLTIGSVSDVTRTAAGAYSSGGNISGFSSRGPTLDGRIKPDLTANGDGLRSTTNTSGGGSLSGTSMATPNASGSSLLLADYFNERFRGHYLRSSSIRALLFNTADDRGNAGPDYTYGWGIVNVRAAAAILKQQAETPGSRVFFEDSLPNGASREWTYAYSGNGPIRVTVAWTDPAGVSTATRNPVLVNNLNLRLIGPDGSEFFPFVLPFTTGSGTTPAFADSLRSAVATTGNNITDNAEQILIAAPAPGVYRVRLNHTGSLVGGQQWFSFAATGLVSDEPVTPGVIGLAPSVATAASNQIFSLTGSGFLPGTDVLFRRAGLADVAAFGEQVSSAAISFRIDGSRFTPGYWDAVVRVPGAAEKILERALLFPGTPPNALPPYFTSPPLPAITGGSLVNHVVTFEDADTDAAALALTASDLPAWLSLVPGPGKSAVLTGVAPAKGSFSFRLNLTDGVYSTAQLFDLPVDPASGNTLPEISGQSLPPGQVGVAFSANLTASDADDHRVTWSVAGAPFWMLIEAQAGGSLRLSGTPPSGSEGTYNLAITATDGLNSITTVRPFEVQPRARVGFGAATASISEGAGAYTVQISRTQSGLGALSINYATANGTATAGGDYSSRTGTVTFADGQTGAQTVQIPIVDDALTEGAETFTVTLSGLTGAADLGTATLTVTIADNDSNSSPVVTLARPLSPAGLVDVSHRLRLDGQVSDDGQPAWGALSVLWSQISGPTGSTATFSPANQPATEVRFPANGVYRLRLMASDGEFSSQRDLTVVVGPIPDPIAGSGLRREVYTGLSGTALSGLTTSAKFLAGQPDSVSTISGGFVAPTNNGDNYGQRLVGLFIPSVTGEHVFSLAADDTSELRLGSGRAPATASLVASVSGATAVNEWTKFPSQTSAPIFLQAGQPYHIEALMKEGTGSDHLAAAVRLPDGTFLAPIPNARLSLATELPVNTAPEISPLSASAIVGVPLPLNPSILDDGLPIGGSLSVRWSRSQGAGTVAFGSEFQASTTVTFGEPGNQVLRLTVGDGGATVSVDVPVAVAGGFLGWIHSQPGVGGATAPEDDPDGDGLANLLEYALGSQPGTAGALPEATLQSGPSGQHLVLAVERDPAAVGVALRIEASTDLETWTTATEAVEILEDSSTRLSVRTREPVDAAFFLRVTAEATPP